MKKTALLTMFILLSSCSSIEIKKDPVDPLENINRAVYGFNEIVDETIIEPVARGYEHITPKYLQNRVSDFFKNIADVTTFYNQLLQGKIIEGSGTFARVVLNSTVGVLGLFDVASDINIPRNNEDFGQTLAVWGVGDGPYLVLPFLGPSNLRDGVGLAVDKTYSELNIIKQMPVSRDRVSAIAVNLVQKRVDLLALTDMLKEKLDPYSFAKESYIQNRKFAIGNGKSKIEIDDF